MKLDQEKKHNLLCKHSGKPVDTDTEVTTEEKVSKKQPVKK